MNPSRINSKVAILDPTQQHDMNSTHKIRIRVGVFRVGVEFGLTQNQPEKTGHFRIEFGLPEIDRKVNI